MCFRESVFKRGEFDDMKDEEDDDEGEDQEV
jgi:hypothetical protein